VNLKFKNFQNILLRNSKEVDSFIKKNLPRNEGLNKKLIQAIKYSILGSGKKIRSFLVIEFCIFVSNINNLDFDKNMLNWPKGYRDTDGIWSKVWYQDVISSTTFNTKNSKEYIVPKTYENIYKECLDIYEEINKYAIKV